MVDILFLIFTLGIAYPWVLIRNVKHIFSALDLQADIEWETIPPNSMQQASASGDMLADGLDLQLI